jgi:hypothetical protein
LSFSLRSRNSRGEHQSHVFSKSFRRPASKPNAVGLRARMLPFAPDPRKPGRASSHCSPHCMAGCGPWGYVNNVFRICHQRRITFVRSFSPRQRDLTCRFIAVGAAFCCTLELEAQNVVRDPRCRAVRRPSTATRRTLPASSRRPTNAVPSNLRPVIHRRSIARSSRFAAVENLKRPCSRAKRPSMRRRFRWKAEVGLAAQLVYAEPRQIHQPRR